jgi:hypothetical protein
MPLEIRELVIKATLDAESGKSQNGGSGKNSGANNTGAQETMINLCVQKVLEILKEKQER